MTNFKRIILTLAIIAGCGCLHSFGNPTSDSPTVDKPPVDIKGKDCEGLINGFSSETVDLLQTDADLLMVESLIIGNKCSKNLSSDSTSVIRMDEYFRLMVPSLLKIDNSDFNLIEIL